MDASTDITGRDFLLKIWKQIAASPLSVGICHEEMPQKTLLNIFYEIGVAQALGKETLIIKSPSIVIPSDFVRTEYITFDAKFKANFSKYLLGLDAQADFYETVADNLEKNPVLSLDYLRRAFLIKGDPKIRMKASSVLKDPSLKDRAKNSVELLAASFWHKPSPRSDLAFTHPKKTKVTTPTPMYNTNHWPAHPINPKTQTNKYAIQFI